MRPPPWTARQTDRLLRKGRGNVHPGVLPDFRVLGQMLPGGIFQKIAHANQQPRSNAHAERGLASETGVGWRAAGCRHYALNLFYLATHCPISAFMEG